MRCPVLQDRQSGLGGGGGKQKGESLSGSLGGAWKGWKVSRRVLEVPHLLIRHKKQEVWQRGPWKNGTWDS
jgi:hypothetical protein